MMRSALAILAVAAVAFPGCHAHIDDDDCGCANWYLTYPNGHPIAASTSSSFVLGQETALLSMVNSHRVAMGIPALIDDGLMRDVARAHSIHMAIGDFTGETNPEGDDAADRADLAGVVWSMYYEAREYGWDHPADVYADFLSDSGTHAIIDDPAFIYAGVGYEFDPDSIWGDYWTMDFRAP